MSTKNSLKLSVDEASGTTAHIYEESLDPDNVFVFLEVTGVKEASVLLAENGNKVSIAIPQGLAKKIGLLSADHQVP